jgi:hypothetical protein
MTGIVVWGYLSDKRESPDDNTDPSAHDYSI